VTGRRLVRTAPVIPGAVPIAAIWAFRDRLDRVGQHRIWNGMTSKGTTPVLFHDDTLYPARHIAWVLHHGTAPVGLVKADCGVRLCMHAPHLTDAASRQRERVLYAALLGVTLAGPCPAGHHDLAEYGYARPTGFIECRGCDNARRRNAATSPEGAVAA